MCNCRKKLDTDPPGTRTRLAPAVVRSAVVNPVVVSPVVVNPVVVRPYVRPYVRPPPVRPNPVRYPQVVGTPLVRPEVRPEVRPPVRPYVRPPVRRHNRQRGGLNPDTAVWGPPLWTILHSLAPILAQDQLFRDFLTALQINIPCHECKSHYTTYIQNNPISDDIPNWLFTLHNVINARLGKPLAPSADIGCIPITSLPERVRTLHVSFHPEVLDILLSLIPSS